MTIPYSRETMVSSDPSKYDQICFMLKERAMNNLKEQLWFQEQNLQPKLVGGFNPVEKYEPKWVHLPQIGMKMKKSLKPPPRKPLG